MKKEWTSEELEKIVRGLKDYDDCAYYAVRFEDKAREVGEICDNSRDNPDREDDRDFPAYDDPEYEDMQELDGTCGWELHDPDYKFGVASDTYGSYLPHAYIITSDRCGYSDWHCYDDGEVLLWNAKVAAVLQ